METGAVLTLGQAHKLTGVSKGTLSKALKSGKLSYINKTSAGYEIDRSELLRVFPIKQARPSIDEQLETPQEARENIALQAKLDAQDRLLERFEAEIDDLKGQRDKWEAHATTQTRLLENQTGQRASVGWFDKLLGR